MSLINNTEYLLMSIFVDVDGVKSKFCVTFANCILHVDRHLPHIKIGIQI